MPRLLNVYKVKRSFTRGTTFQFTNRNTNHNAFMKILKTSTNADIKVSFSINYNK